MCRLLLVDRRINQRVALAGAEGSVGYDCKGVSSSPSPSLPVRDNEEREWSTLLTVGNGVYDLLLHRTYSVELAALESVLVCLGFSSVPSIKPNVQNHKT